MLVLPKDIKYHTLGCNLTPVVLKFVVQDYLGGLLELETPKS